ncbi:MAG: hypothetical protein ABSB32_02355 [Thermodesulfobacteriota bacterium]|jgi:hypothetical protein
MFGMKFEEKQARNGTRLTAKRKTPSGQPFLNYFLRFSKGGIDYDYFYKMNCEQPRIIDNNILISYGNILFFYTKTVKVFSFLDDKEIKKAAL